MCRTIIFSQDYCSIRKRSRHTCWRLSLFYRCLDLKKLAHARTYVHVLPLCTFIRCFSQMVHL